MIRDKKKARSTGKRTTKSWFDMDADELAEATREFDREDLSEPKPLRGRKLARYKRAQAKRGRPPVGNGSKAISVSIDKALLAQVDRAARSRHLTRSQLIALTLRRELAG